MTKAMEALKDKVFAHVAECRASLQGGRENLTGLEEMVREYCGAVASLPKEEGKAHAQDLERLMDDIGALSLELVEARETVRRELTGLGRLKQASVAYHKSDAIGPVYRPKREED
jgi:phage host-nuclease inhibitor protein Gam